MIKIQIDILDGCLEIEIKKNINYYSLIVIISKSETFKENGRAWSGEINEEKKVIEIVNLIKECYNNPAVPIAFTINDGRRVKIRLEEDAADINLDIKHSYAEEHGEHLLVEKIFYLINEIIQDQTLKEYSLIFGDIDYR
jgi:hypothetical protein